jgi:tetratricopeptide (TPR) repeat protein
LASPSPGASPLRTLHGRSIKAVAENESGYRDIPEEDRKKAETFFAKAASVGNAGQYDFAIEMFIQGLNMDPESIEAHQALRDISLKRKVSGGKAMGMFESIKFKKPSKDDKQSMLNAEKLLAYDPGNTDHMVTLLEQAAKGGFYETVLWIGPILLKANSEAKKPEFNKYIRLRDVYKTIKHWKLATEACQYAVNMKPDDMDLGRELKDLSAQTTIQEGNYAGAGSFRKSVKDMEGQSKLMAQDRDIRTVDQMKILIDDAEKEWQADPNEPGKLMKLVDLLVKTEQPDQENRAVELLEKAYERTKLFRYRQAIGRIKITQLSRMERTMRAEVARSPNDEGLKEEYRNFLKDRAQQELDEYTLWSENYPTDLGLKYQIAARLFQLGRYDEAIPVFQTARSDPKYRAEATIALGRSFLSAGFIDEAVDTLKAMIDDYQIKGDDKSINMTYWYGRSLEEKKDKPAALKAYSQVAQWNFNYLDVQARIKRLRTDLQNGANSPEEK